MTTAARTLRQEPRPRGRVLDRAAAAILDRVLGELRAGALDVTLPDGSGRRYGEGAAVAVRVHDWALLRRLGTRGKLGLGESYTAGEWETDDLVAFFELLLRNAEAAYRRHPRLRRLLTVRARPNTRNGLLRARRNIAYHYDLGNDLFALMLDETMTYSCAVFEQPGETLAEAQRNKYRRICERLRLEPGDRLLDIGCGWGGFAAFAAGEYGCSVTGLTISAAQAALARERTSGLDVRILEQDYREHEGSYAKIASIEMIEAIGERQFGVFFAALDRLLEQHGIACVQTILVPDERWDRYRKTADWIERYIFPGCLIPSLGALARAAAGSSRLMIHEVDEIGGHYAETIRRWRESFHEHLEQIRSLGYDERFERTWDFYLAFCEAAFRTRALRDVQLTLTRAFNERIPA
jgi:cyclopropane-fatty-acyl-phospholipid synthase